MKSIPIFVAFLLTLLFLTSVNADKRIYEKSIVISSVTSIYDADTFRANIDHWPPIVGERVPIRVMGVDAPEIRGKCQKEKELARLAKQFTVDKLRDAKTIELRNVRRGKYFRLLADVYIDGNSLTQQLISSGHARPYNGGTREGWCEN